MDEHEDLEQRLTRLEENGWFQERKLAELSAYSEELRLQIDSLEKHCIQLRQAMTHLENELYGLHQQADPLPPHWQEKPEQFNIPKKGESA